MNSKTHQFQGSTNAGRLIGAIAGRKLNSFTAELGGKAPVIVFGKTNNSDGILRVYLHLVDNANINVAVNGVTFGSFIASGQVSVGKHYLELLLNPASDMYRSNQNLGSALHYG
jgi:acyl-CoA reductase-like NAD-dependent aldehyde dehydrogenase